MERSHEQKKRSFAVLIRIAYGLSEGKAATYYLDKLLEAGIDYARQDHLRKDLAQGARFGIFAEGPEKRWKGKEDMTVDQALSSIEAVLQTPQTPPRPARGRGSKKGTAPSDEQIMAFFRARPGGAAAESLLDDLGLDDSRLRQQTYGKMGRLKRHQWLTKLSDKPLRYEVGPRGAVGAFPPSVPPVAASPAARPAANPAPAKGANGTLNGGDHMGFEDVLVAIDTWTAKRKTAKDEKDTTAIQVADRVLNALTARLEGSVQ